MILIIVRFFMSLVLYESAPGGLDFVLPESSFKWRIYYAIKLKPEWTSKGFHLLMNILITFYLY